MQKHARSGAQVIDLAGMSPINMLQHVRREDAQSEWQHNMDYCPETLNKVRPPCVPPPACALTTLAGTIAPVLRGAAHVPITRSLQC